MTNTNDSKGQHMSKTYFAADGKYGDAENLIVIDTTDWTDDEWAIIQYSPADERHLIASDLEREISESIQPTLF
jgi:hypothetical protein